MNASDFKVLFDEFFTKESEREWIKAAYYAAVPVDTTLSRIHFPDGRVKYFKTFKEAHRAWIELPPGVRAALRSGGNSLMLLPSEFV